jgi:hypothetical protein
MVALVVIGLAGLVAFGLHQHGRGRKGRTSTGRARGDQSRPSGTTAEERAGGEPRWH